MRQTRCIDCNTEGRVTGRAALKPGPRCLEHYRAKQKRSKESAHAKRIEQFFGISGGFYWGLYKYQEGKCFICRVSTGERKRLAVDHDHNKEGCTHDPKMGCPNCIRALLCGPCNELVGRFPVDALLRAIIVLSKNAPAQRFRRGLAIKWHLTTLPSVSTINQLKLTRQAKRPKIQPSLSQ